MMTEAAPTRSSAALQVAALSSNIAGESIRSIVEHVIVHLRSKRNWSALSPLPRYSGGEGRVRGSFLRRWTSPLTPALSPRSTGGRGRHAAMRTVFHLGPGSVPCVFVLIRHRL